MIYIASLVIIEIILFFTNYRSGTFLIGWDNVMPEFNFWLNFQRSIFGVWQDYRGLGTLDGMAHTANFFHTTYIFLLSLVLPQDMLRYVFIMLTHLVGGIGFFILTSYLFKDELKKINNKALCFAGSLFYMFNLGVIQMFFAPLEVFVIHFAALPWLALLITKTLKNPKPQNFLLLFVVSLLSTPQGFVPTIFIVFCILLGFVALVNIISTKNFKIPILVVLTVLLANAFWLIPYSYSALKNQDMIRNTRINEFSSEEIYFRNKAEGNIRSVSTFKGFMLNTIEYDNGFGGDVLFMLNWYQHYNSLQYQLIFIFLIPLVLIGLAGTVIRKDSNLIPFALTMLVSFVFLANNTIIFEQINDLLRRIIPVLGEAFRFPFTKFIILFAFCFSVFLTYGLILISKLIKIKQIKFVILGIIFLIITYLAFPAFQGQFTSPLLRLKLPEYYKETISYFSSKNDDGRIAIFPMYTFWNWQYRNWGNRGSGFLWYGIPQPLTERAFDPWSGYNEEFYNELSNAVNTRNKSLFMDVTSKYNIKYILIDSTILNSITRSSINYASLQQFVEGTNVISDKKSFGKIIIYELKNNTSPIFALNNPVKVSPSSIYNNDDLIYSNLGNYVIDQDNPEFSYLMPSLFTGKLQKDNNFEFTEDKDTITFISKKIKPISIYRDTLIEIPSLYLSEFLIPVELKTTRGKISISVLNPTVYLNDKKIEVQEKPDEIETSFENVSHVTFGDIDYSVPFKNGVVRSYILNNFPNTVKFGDGIRGESFIIDTRNINNSPFLIPVPKGKINEIKIVIKKVKGPFGTDNIITQNYDLKRNIGGFELYPNKIVVNTKRKRNSAILEAQGNSSAELSFYKDNLFHQASYILFINSKHISGLPVNFYMDNSFQDRPELETKLSKNRFENVLVVPKTEEIFKGYGFHFIVKSAGIEKAKASIDKISLYPFPEQTIRRIRLLNNTDSKSLVKNATQSRLEFNKIIPSLYTVKAPESSAHIVLSQAYDSGWMAYRVKDDPSLLQLTFPFVFGKKLDDHVMVNNWANGWYLDQSSIADRQSSIVIVYLPQYLQYAGFILSLFTLIFVIFRTFKNGKKKLTHNNLSDRLSEYTNSAPDETLIAPQL